MNPGSIVNRELLVASRRKTTFVARVVAAVTASGLGLALLYAGLAGMISPSSAGHKIFFWLSSLGFVYALFNGALSTADCLSREHREGTLGLLFLTDLHGADIVAGKIMAQPWNIFYSLMATIPATAFVFFLGGVTFEDFLKAGVALANTVFFGASLGMLVSTFSQRESKAIAAALGFAALFGLGMPFCGLIHMASAGSTTMPGAYLWLSPSGPMLAVFFPTIIAGSSPGQFYIWSLVSSHLLGWIALILACLVLPLSVQQSLTPTGTFLHILRKPLTFRNLLRQRATQYRVGVEKWWIENPVFHAGVYHHAGSHSPTKRFAVLAALFVVLVLAYPEGWISPLQKTRGFPVNWFSPPVIPLGILGLHFWLQFALTVEACHVLGHERRQGTLELLLTTPLGDDQVLRGWLLTLKRRYAGPFVILVGLDIFLLITGLIQVDSGEKFFLTLIFVGAILLTAMNLYSLAWVGLWSGLKDPSATRAIRHTLLRVLLMPWIIAFAIGGVCGLLVSGLRMPEELAVFFAMTGCLFSFVTVPLGYLGWAINGLKDEFRYWACQGA